MRFLTGIVVNISLMFNAEKVKTNPVAAPEKTKNPAPSRWGESGCFYPAAFPATGGARFFHRPERK